jgi:hypothetical protein
MSDNDEIKRLILSATCDIIAVGTVWGLINNLEYKYKREYNITNVLVALAFSTCIISRYI